MLLAAPAGAQQLDCDNAEAQTEMTACAELDWQQADEVLNGVYGVAMDAMQQIDAELPEDEKGAAANLKQGQLAWITFRDATCAAEGYAMHGGSAEPMVVYGCRARLTEQRAQDLELMAQPY